MQSFFRIGVVLGFLFLVVPFGQAHDGASGPTKARMDAMVEMGRSLKALTLTAKSSGLVGNSDAIQHIKALMEKGTALPELFTPKEIPAMSEALPKIWDDPDSFSARTQEYDEAVSALNAAIAANEPDAANAALRDVTRSCGTCHQEFRK